MKLLVKAHGIKFTKSMHTALENKLEFLEKFLKEDTRVDVKVNVEKNSQKVTVLFTFDHQTIKFEETSNDFYETVDLLSDKLKNHMGKLHKIKQRKVKETFIDCFEDDELKLNPDKIVKRKAFSMKPMTEEEAILQMDLLGHPSFMFCNADLDFVICLLYKRKDGKYGIIETLFDE